MKDVIFYRKVALFFNNRAYALSVTNRIIIIFGAGDNTDEYNYTKF